ncbi:hypothetical protein LOD99_5096 [Oopsacas minuta]|uniref:DUF1279 domain-containing protein n=1 Tax=Oopsacas minuta TaxID=111878 RepID=A0AAV7JS13_9METZ|nr:hypothetical protein LOD99_5096 [Oopsacas minuta]
MLISRIRWIPILSNSLKSKITLFSPTLTHCCSITRYQPSILPIPPHSRSFSNQQTEKNMTRTQKLKVLLKEYGPLAMGLYLTIGCISLGTCYAVIHVGVNVEGVLNYFGMEVSQKTAGFSTLAAAYLLHKLLLPFRLGITIGGVPVIARYLRKLGWMKPSIKKPKDK